MTTQPRKAASRNEYIYFTRRYKMINKGELWQGDINGVIVKITDRKIESGRVYVKYKQLDKYGSPVLPEREVTEQAFSHCGMRRIK